MLRDEIITEAKRYVDAKTKWAHRGRTITGVDCIGLICGVGDAFGLEYEDLEGYSRNPDGRFVDHIMKYMTYRTPQEVKKGCAVILRDTYNPCHIGIISERYGQLSLIHASVAKKRVVEEEWDSYWTSRFRCALDFPGIED